MDYFSLFETSNIKSFIFKQKKHYFNSKMKNTATRGFISSDRTDVKIFYYLPQQQSDSSSGSEQQQPDLPDVLTPQVLDDGQPMHFAPLLFSLIIYVIAPAKIATITITAITFAIRMHLPFDSGYSRLV